MQNIQLPFSVSGSLTESFIAKCLCVLAYLHTVPIAAWQCLHNKKRPVFPNIPNVPKWILPKKTKPPNSALPLLIAGFLTAIVYCRIKKLYFLEYFDLAVASISMAQGFGRIGCFLAGCCYGRETNAWYGITFHNSPFAPNEVALIPTQLISSVADFAHFFILIFLAKRVKHKGVVTAMYLIFYSVGRFLIEMLRNDPRGTISVMSTSQFISIFTLVAGIFMFVFCRRKRQGEEKQEA